MITGRPGERSITLNTVMGNATVNKEQYYLLTRASMKVVKSRCRVASESTTRGETATVKVLRYRTGGNANDAGKRSAAVIYAKNRGGKWYGKALSLQGGHRTIMGEAKRELRVSVNPVANNRRWYASSG